MKRIAVIALLVLSGTVSVVAQQQPTSPCPSTTFEVPTTPLKPREGRIYLQAERGERSANGSNAPFRMLKTQQGGTNLNSPDCNVRVAEHVTIKPGPIGELYLVNGLNDYLKVDSARVSTSVFPSLIFDMSASPMYRLNDTEKKRKAVNTKLDLLWRDVTVTLSATCKTEDNATSDCSSRVSVLEVLPNQSSSGQKDSAPAQVASAISGLGTAAAPFFPASTFNEKVAAAGDGLTVLFRNLFPPHTETYFHSFLGDELTFGWNYRENTSAEKDSTLLGLRRGVVLLKAPKNLFQLTVHCYIMSKWSDDLGPPFDDPYNMFSQDWVYELPAEKNNSTDYESLPNLDSFPALMHVGDLLNVLHLVNKYDFDQLLASCRLMKGDGLDSVTKASLKSHLLTLNYSASQVDDIIGGYQQEISKPEVIKVICRYNSSRCPSRDKIPAALSPGLNDYFKRSDVEKYLGIEKKKPAETR
jgi:hypothetical protein